MNLARLNMTQKIKKGDIWLANLNPTRGTEPGKTRPVLIIQDQTLLDIQHPSTLIIPLTTTIIECAQPLRVRIKAQDRLKKDSDLLIDQIRAIDNQRLTKGPLATLDDEMLKFIYTSIFEVMGAFDLLGLASCGPSSSTTH
jgi:mRNA interferase MazF